MVHMNEMAKKRTVGKKRAAREQPVPQQRQHGNNLLSTAVFTKSAPELHHLPPDTGAEVAFAGRSNAGKSSALNALTGRAQLARVSKTPGRTQQLIVFELDPERRLIDLPGYGYAKVPMAMRDRWRIVLDRYFTERVALRGLVLAMDVRHPLTEFDRNMLAFSAARVLPTHVLLTKADKLSRSQGLTTLRAVLKEIETLQLPGSAQLLSSVTKDGVEEARAVVCGWLGFARS